MSTLNLLLLVATASVMAVWCVVSTVLFIGWRRSERRRHVLSDVRARLATDHENTDSLERRLTTIEPALIDCSSQVLLDTIGDPQTPAFAASLLSAYLSRRVPLEQLVARARSPRQTTATRVAALRVLSAGSFSEIDRLLEDLLGDGDLVVAEAAVSVLGHSTDPRAATILIHALCEGMYPASRVATYLDQFASPVASELLPLLEDGRPHVRYWAVVLLARYPSMPGLGQKLASLKADPDAQVRKAAVGSMARIGGPAAVTVAVELLDDAVPFVRAHAARALGDLGQTDMAACVAPLLADSNWWVRLAAKESLEAMGSEVWSELVPFLDHADPFARNGAAEVFQNIGVLDRLVVMAAATDAPDCDKIEMLRKIANAGGVHMTDALLMRAEPHVQSRIRQVLEMLGLEHVEVHR